MNIQTKQHTKERRTTTVETVIELAAEQNPSDITTTAIAQHMGLTQGALFKHFPTKDAIWEAVMSWVSECLLARIDQATRNVTSPTAALEAMFLAHIAFISQHPGVPRMLFGELQRQGNTLTKRLGQTLLKNYKERLKYLVETGKTKGELDCNLDVDAASALFIGSIQGLVIQSLLYGDTKLISREAKRVFAIYLRGIRSAS